MLEKFIRPTHSVRLMPQLAQVNSIGNYQHVSVMVVHQSAQALVTQTKFVCFLLNSSSTLDDFFYINTLSLSSLVAKGH